MDLPSVQAREVMGTRFDSWIDDYFLETIPEEFIDETKTVCLIREWLNEPTSYANWMFKGWQIGVEIQIFYKKDADVSDLNQEIEVARWFVAHNWIVEQSKNHIQDPDTNQVTKVFYFSKRLMLKEWS